MRRITGLLTAVLLIAGAGAALAQVPLPPDEVIPGQVIQCDVGLTDGTIVYVTVGVTDQTLASREVLCTGVGPAAEVAEVGVVGAVEIHTPASSSGSRWVKPWSK